MHTIVVIIIELVTVQWVELYNVELMVKSVRKVWHTSVKQQVCVFKTNHTPTTMHMDSDTILTNCLFILMYIVLAVPSLFIAFYFDCTFLLYNN